MESLIELFPGLADVKLIKWLPRLAIGTVVTIQVGLMSLLVASLLGLLGAWGKLSDSKIANRSAEIYTTVIRGIPDLVLLLLFYYGGQVLLNDLGKALGWWDYVEIDPFTAGVLVLGLIYGAYLTETFRGAFLSIPKGQIEAGLACGMGRWTLFHRIIWPQLIRYALPSFGNNWLVLLKSTALISIINLDDVVRMASLAGKHEHEPFYFFAAVIVVFLVLTSISSFFLNWAERHYTMGVRRG